MMICGFVALPLLWTLTSTAYEFARVSTGPGVEDAASAATAAAVVVAAAWPAEGVALGAAAGDWVQPATRSNAAKKIIPQIYKLIFMHGIYPAKIY
jgi:hypothetical protein